MPPVSEATVLVSVDARDPEEPSDGLIRLLGPHSLVLLGYWQVPDQSTTGQLREQFGEEATATLESLAARFADAGADVTTQVVFTHDWSETVERVATEHDVDALFTEDPFRGELDRVLVPLRGDDNLERIVGFVALLLRESHAEVTLFNVADTEGDAQTGEFILRGACDRLEEEGVDADRLEWRQERADSAQAAIVDAASEYGLIVVGESDPSLRERILGGVTNRVIANSPVPVLIVRRR